MTKEQSRKSRSRPRPYCPDLLRSRSSPDIETREDTLRYYAFLQNLQEQIDAMPLPPEEIPLTESILTPVWDRLNGEPIGDPTQPYPYNIIKRKVMMALKGPKNRLRVRLTVEEQAAYDRFLEDLEKERLLIADEHFASLARHNAAAKRAAERAAQKDPPPEHDHTGLGCVLSGGKQSRKRKRKNKRKTKNNKLLYVWKSH